MIETTWIPLKQHIIDDISKQLNISTNYIDFSINEVNSMNFRIYVNSQEVINGFRTLFEPTSQTCTECFILYVDIFSCEKLKEILSLKYNINTHCIGLFDETSKVGLISGDSAFGLIKSTVIGIYSFYLQKFKMFPVHAAILDYKDNGCLFIGAGGAGKTSIILNLMTKLRNQMKILTDDWAVLSEDANKIIAQSIEKRISYKNIHIHENEYITELLIAYNNNYITGLTKVYVNPEDIFGEHSFVNISNIQKIVVLFPINTGKFLYPITIKNVLDMFISTTYHMPNCNSQFVHQHRQFWENNFQNIPVWACETRHPIENRESLYEKLIALLDN